MERTLLRSESASLKYSAAHICEKIPQDYGNNFPEGLGITMSHIVTRPGIMLVCIRRIEKSHDLQGIGEYLRRSCLSNGK